MLRFHILISLRKRRKKHRSYKKRSQYKLKPEIQGLVFL
ncbi:Hypothetical protein Minf_1906 [Methylacidiphilum infernorum V4]|uniref:Uncharacterized protein n=1 Tax=Methylacidiphilum infernorum (isolate V4) TaxID=481448 RepID=B3DY08_METI4|nr:Hypothetical protein Minf_1906 [Methylacidiphilum infernorum V4]